MSTKSALRQAQLEAEVQYGPQASALAQLLRDESSTLHTSYRQAHAQRVGISSSIRSARPVVKRTLNQADRTRRRAVQFVNRNLSHLDSPKVQTYKAVIAGESAGARTRFAEFRRDTMQDLTRRRLEARSAESYMRQNALNTYNLNRGRIGQQLVDLSHQKGAFVAATLGDLLNTEADRKLKLQSLLETGRHNRATEHAADERNRISGSKGKGGGGGGSSKGRQGRSWTQIHNDKATFRSLRARAEVDKRRQPHWSQQDMYRYFVSHLKADPILAYAATQYAYFGGVGKKTRGQVWHTYGFHLPLFHGGPSLSDFPR